MEVLYPKAVEERSGGFWLRATNLWKGRRHFLRNDNSNRQRYLFKTDNGNQSGDLPDPAPVPLSRMAEDPNQTSFRFVILADTGQGTRSQYALLPLIRALDPDFMIINGDLAYPAGETIDYSIGFFEPYRGLGIPIWATMGNHEYYSEHYGQEFYDVFCRRVRRKDWDDASLRFIPQPGPYWELRQSPEGTAGLVVLGVDSGQEANLDGVGMHGFIDYDFGFHPDQSDYSDARQENWLRRRLVQADNEGSSVIILYHIPALVDQNHAGSTHLTGLHQAIATHACVKLVACGHVHNFQCYDQATFVRYLNDRYAKKQTISQPHYIVSGNAGAGLGSPIFKQKNYAAQCTCPSTDDWNKHVKEWNAAVGRLSIKENLLRTLAGAFSPSYRIDALADADLGQYMSLIVVDVTPNGATATPAFLTDVKAVATASGILPAGALALDVSNPTHRFTPAGVNACLQNGLGMVLR